MEENIKKIRTGDIVLTTLYNFAGYVILYSTGSVSNHVAIAVWVSEKGLKEKTLDIQPWYSEGAELHFLEISRKKCTDYRYDTPRSGVIINPWIGVKTRVGRTFIRPISREIPDDVVISKLLDFIEKEKNCEYELSFLQMLDIYFNISTSSYSKETCVSFTLKWLQSLGYEMDDEKVPNRSKHLYTPDHLLEDYNSSKVFEGKEFMLYNIKTILSPGLYFIVLCVVVILITTIIWTFFFSLGVFTKAKV